MNALHAFYLLSTLGAVLFLFAGWALASLSKPKKPVDEQPALLNRVAQLEQLCQQQAEQCKNAQAAYAQLEQQDAELHNLANTAQSQNLNLNRQLQDLQENLRKAESRATQLENRSSTTADPAPNTQAHQKLNDLQDQLDSAIAARDRSRSDLAQTNASLDQLKAELRASIESAKGRELAWEKDRSAFLKDRATYEKSLLQIQEIPKLRTSLADAEAQTRLVKNQFNAAYERLKDADALRSELEDVKHSFGELESKKRLLEAETKAGQTEIDALRKALRDTEAREKSEKLGLDASRLELGSARRQLQQLDNQVTSAKTEAELARKECDLLKKVLADSTSENSTQLDAQLSLLKNELETAKQESQTLRKQLQRIQASADTTTHSAKESAAKLENAIFELNTSLQSTRDENEQLVSRAKAVETESQNYKLIETQLKETRTALDVAQKKASQSQDLASALTESKESLRQAHAQLASLQALESELKELKLKYQSTEAKANEVSSLREENRQLRQDTAELSNLAKTSAELDALNAEYRRIRLESELLSRRVEELSKERETAIDMASQIKDLENTIHELSLEKEKSRDLESRLFALGAQNDEPPASVSPISIATLQSDMQSSLTLLLQRNGIRCAVLADNAGLLVAGVGDESHNEGLAAMSGLVESLVLQLQDLLPISHVNTVSLYGSHGAVVSTRLFPATDGVFAITTLGLSAPPSDSIDKSIALLGRQISPTD